MSQQIDCPFGFRGIPQQIFLCVNWNDGKLLQEVKVTDSMFAYSRVLPHDNTYSTPWATVMKVLWDEFKMKPIAKIAMSDNDKGVMGLVYDWAGEDEEVSNAVKLWKWFKPELGDIKND